MNNDKYYLNAMLEIYKDTCYCGGNTMSDIERECEKDLVNAMKEIILLMMVYFRQISADKNVPDLVIGLVGGLKAVNRARKEPDVVIDNFNLLFGDNEYIMLYEYLDDYYNKEA